MIVHDNPPHNPNEQFPEYKPDITLEYNDFIKVDFPDGTTMILSAGWDSPRLRGSGVAVYEDKDSNPVLSYHRHHPEEGENG